MQLGFFAVIHVLAEERQEERSEHTCTKNAEAWESGARIHARYIFRGRKLRGNIFFIDLCSSLYISRFRYVIFTENLRARRR